MKKLFVICLSIIVISILINLGLHMNRVVKKANIGNDTQNNENLNGNTKKNDTNEKNDEKDKLTDYYNIKREKIDRPIMYSIGNTPQALPHYGIYGAEYVYEVVAEGGITRLLAIFTRGDIEKIGPIRSARHNFFDISLEYNAIIAHFGGSPKAFSDISTLGLPSLNGIALDGTMYYRDKNRRAPDNAYTSIDKTLEYANKYKYNKEVVDNHFKYYETDTSILGSSANSVEIDYSYAQIVKYEYDEKLKVFNRFMKGKPHIDEQINKQLTAKNIIIQFASHHSIDDENRQDITLVGSGKGYYITNGKYIDITWQKSSRTSITKYYDVDNNETSLNKGQTWIQVVPLTSKVNISE